MPFFWCPDSSLIIPSHSLHTAPEWSVCLNPTMGLKSFNDSPYFQLKSNALNMTHKDFRGLKPSSHSSLITCHSTPCHLRAQQNWAIPHSCHVACMSSSHLLSPFFFFGFPILFFIWFISTSYSSFMPQLSLKKSPLIPKGGVDASVVCTEKTLCANLYSSPWHSIKISCLFICLTYWPMSSSWAKTILVLYLQHPAPLKCGTRTELVVETF